MPNRILKESIRESDSIDKLSWFEEVLFYRLIVSCDDYGRFDGRVSVIKNRLFPLKESLTLNTVAGAIGKLVTAGLVTLYEFEGKPYLYLPTWTAHQNVRAKRSKYPDPDAPGSTLLKSASTCKQMKSQEINGKQPQADAPVIQSNTESESVSVSISESESESISGGGDTREADEKELALIGLKRGEHPFVTRNRVERVIADTEELFRKYREGNKSTPLDRRMVFLLSDSQGNCELVNYAFEQAQMAGKVSDWRYIAGIVRSLRDRNIATVEQAREWDENRPDLTGEELVASTNNLLQNIGRKKDAP